MTGAQRVPKAGEASGSFAVTVEFRLRPGATARFTALVLENAAASLLEEDKCRRFDVLAPPQGNGGDDLVFLYEIYDDRAAFAAHLDSRHFKVFDQATRDLVLTKTVREFTVLDPPNERT